MATAEHVLGLCHKVNSMIPDSDCVFKVVSPSDILEVIKHLKKPATKDVLWVF